MNLETRKVTLVVAHYSWYGKRPWYEPILSVPIITRILKPMVGGVLYNGGIYFGKIDGIKGV